MDSIPYRQIRAAYTAKTIRIYQAYSDNIADVALEAGTFISPPFKMERMTWIKPSFLWMMYRSGWGNKPGQERILAIDITRNGFEWALKNSLLSHKSKDYSNKEEWLKIKKSTPVRIQWDPERDLFSRPLEYRSIQIGLCKEAVELYVGKWIQKITDITKITKKIHSLLMENNINEASSLLPEEVCYQLSSKLKTHLGVV